MANVDSPFGFVPIGTTDGSDYHGKIRKVAIDTAANLFINDTVSITTNVNTITSHPLLEPGFYNVVVPGTAGSLVPLAGTLVSLDPDLTDEGSFNTNHYVAGSANRTGNVVFGTKVLFAVKESQVGTTAVLAADDAFKTIRMKVGTGNSVSGISGMTIDPDNVTATTVGGQFRIYHLVREANNAIITVAGDDAPTWVVSLNNSQDAPLTV